MEGKNYGIRLVGLGFFILYGFLFFLNAKFLSREPSIWHLIFLANLGLLSLACLGVIAVKEWDMEA